MSPLKLAASLFLPLGLVVAAACSSSSGATEGGPDCRENPASCKAGETCWPVTATSFACLTSEPSGMQGAACKETPGQATCADGLLCDATNSTGSGICTAYCGAGGHECPGGYACVTTTVSGGTGSMSICRGEQNQSADGGVIYIDGGTFGTDGSAYDAYIPIPPNLPPADGGQVQR
jgi:hypothetical protein